MYMTSMPDSDLGLAHKHCIQHRAEVEASEICGCFYCLSTFHRPRSWSGSTTAKQHSARGARSTRFLGPASGLPITRNFLERMHERWF